MMEFPADEVAEHYGRYADFFEAHDIIIGDPLEEFRSREIPDAEATLAGLEDPEHPHAEGGFADDVYVETENGIVVGDRTEEIHSDYGESVHRRCRTPPVQGLPSPTRMVTAGQTRSNHYQARSAD